MHQRVSTAPDLQKGGRQAVYNRVGFESTVADPCVDRVPPVMAAPTAPVPANGARAAPDWTCLSRDILGCILAYLPLRPRVRIVSLVCRQWRQAVLASVTRVASNAPTALHSLPSLTAFRSRRGAVFAADPPTWLRSMSHYVEYEGDLSIDCQCSRLSSLAGLTSLTLAIHRTLYASKLCCSWALDLIRRNSESLTDLRLETTTSEIKYNTPDPPLPVIRLPHLRSLAVIERNPESIIAQLARTNAAQLTRFTALNGRLHRGAPPRTTCVQVTHDPR